MQEEAKRGKPKKSDPELNELRHKVPIGSVRASSILHVRSTSSLLLKTDCYHRLGWFSLQVSHVPGSFDAWLLVYLS